MKFRPCIDLHNGKVKQIVGASLKDDSQDVIENFVAENSSKFMQRCLWRTSYTGDM